MTVEESFKCECPLGQTVVCRRHGTVKSARQVQICSGQDVSDKVRDSWLKTWGELVEAPSRSQNREKRQVRTVRGRKNLYAFSALTIEDVPCEFRGEAIRTQKCDVCGSTSKEATVYACSNESVKDHECTFSRKIKRMTSCQTCPIGREKYEQMLENLEKERMDARNAASTPNLRTVQWAKRHSPFNYKPGASGPKFISRRQLADDILSLVSKIPPDTSRIIGVARSGISVATQVAMYLHLPLSIFRQNTYDLIEAGNGWRLTGNTGGQGPPVVIDDTCMSGNSFRYVMPVVRQTYPSAISACVYCNPAARVKPDIWVHDLPWPHFLEWNLFNSIMSEGIATDFDGILCRDCHPHEDDDGDKYLNFIRNATPLYAIRRTHIKMIVTARIEKYREETLKWLARHGMVVDKLVMAPYPTTHERRKHDVAAFKAGQFKQFMKMKHRVQPPCFIESDPQQAKRINELSKGIVICPSSGECHA